MKKYIIPIIVLLISGILISVIVIFNNKDEDPYLKEITYEEYVSKVNNNETFILYVKQTDCPHCLAFTPIFSKVLNDYKIEANYINLTNMNKEEMEILTTELSIDGTPLVMFFKNGIELGKFSRISGEKSYKYIVNKLKIQDYIKEESN